MADLFTEDLKLKIPARFAVRGRVAGNLVRQLAEPANEASIGLTPSSKGLLSDASATTTFAFVKAKVAPPKNYQKVIRVEADNTTELTARLAEGAARWLKPKPVDPNAISESVVASRIAATLASWSGGLQLREEIYDGDALVTSGFRPPQIGAIHAAKAHWVVSDAPATLVMPTGTGKTETMLALLISEKIEKLLVIVPSDQLRAQVSEKFETLGLLKEIGLVGEEAIFPLVATLKRAPKTIKEVDAIFRRSQVVVATMQSISRLPSELQDRIVEHLSHLFVDEAHHIAAATWKSLKSRFLTRKRKILQFTATPYRNDARRVDGKFIFVYPLRRAQEQHLFRPVRYVPVMESPGEQADLVIIKQVGAALDLDREAGFDHLAMARTSSIDRAEKLVALYRRHLPRYPADVAHSRMSASERSDVLRRLRSGEVRVVVCVDMLGEGFDLPRLKIAGLHDRHRSEAITLQFIGRFTRAQKDIGNATVVASVSLDDPREWLNALYKEDADWNSLLEVGSSARVDRERLREDLYSGLDRDFDEIPAETITPKLNAFVFRVSEQRWNPHALVELETPTIAVVEGPIINDELSLVMAVTRHEDRLRWTRSNSPVDVIYNLVMAHWDQDQGLLYVHSSPEDGMSLTIARLLCGDDVVPLRGEAVFRVLHGYRRVMLTNLGVKETQVKPIRFQLSTGVDITPQLESTVDNRTRVKTNLFGHGYVDEPIYAGDDLSDSQSSKRTIGCSTKGKIWSQDAAVYPGDWVNWCKTIGPKIADESISTEMVLRNVLRPKRLDDFPRDKVPLSIDWPEGFSISDEDRVELTIQGTSVPLSACELEIASFAPGDRVRFRLKSDTLKAEYSLTIKVGLASFRKEDSVEVTITRGKRTRDLIELFREDPPAIRFTDGDMLVGADLAAAPADEAPLFDLTLMTPLDWTGVDITKESQGENRRAGTVQNATISRLLAASQPYDIIFDGDASGEVADVVAMRRQGRFLDVELYHCKFSSEAVKGARVEDLYEICGQAMKAVRWADPRSKFMQRLRRQEELRLQRGGQTRFQIGNRALLDEWLSNRREFATRFSMTLVQPGYSKSQTRTEHLPILGAVRSYLSQTYNIGLSVWSNS